MYWRLGLDIGTNSIGWSAIRLSNVDRGNGDEAVWRPDGLLSSGVRVFPDGRNPKDKQSLAARRRIPRGMRKRRDRYLKRRSEFMDRLIAHGLMPGDEIQRKALEQEDPWTLRVRGLDEKLSPHQLGRALFHLQQRRGFKSNRKTDKGAEDEKGKIKQAAVAVQEAMVADGARTLGELLARPRVKDPIAQHTNPVRARLKGAGAKAFYDFYPTREMIEYEFDCLWGAQQEYHGEALSETARESLKDTLLFQRPLKAQPVGKCSLDPAEQRAPRALPSVQRFRIYQDINHLKLRLPGEAERKLTLAERDTLIEKSLNAGKLKFDAMRRALKLPDDCRFNTESLKRKHLDGDRTAAVLAAEGKRPRWGKGWRELPAETQEKIVERLLEEEDEEALLAWLMAEHGLDKARAEAVANAPLPDGHANLGRTAIAKVLEWLSSDAPEATDPQTGEVYSAPFTYDQAVRLAGYESHSALDAEKASYDRLPYYGEVLERHVAFGTGEPDDMTEKRIGKIANPTVHVALNQVRRVVNALVARYGPPMQTVIELARDLPLSAQGKSELERTQRDNQNSNDRRREELNAHTVADTYDNRLKLRLWEELNPSDPLGRRCPYSGEPIGISTLLSSEIEIDHILPFSRTLDDSAANKTVCFRKANRDKGNSTPHEAFASNPAGYDWQAISERAAQMPNNKSWRFGPDAMDRYDNEERDFLDRQLNETRYVSRLAKTYLECTCPDVWVTPGRLTADLRWAWGLDSILAGHNVEDSEFRAKNRNDHRNHAIDAIVVGLTDRGLLNRIAKNAGRAEEEFSDRLLAEFDEPWPDFRGTVRDSVQAVIVSHKPDHGVQGALHNDTAYGLVSEPDTRGKRQVVHRVPLSTLSKPGSLDAVRDPVIRAHLKAETEGLSGKDFTDALVAAGEDMSPPVRRVRIVETLTVIPISDRNGRAYKAYKGDANYCYDIFANEKGQWTGSVTSTFAANQKRFDPHARATADGTPLVMRLRQNDLLAVELDGVRRHMRVVKFSTGQIVLAEHFEAGALKARDADKEDDFKYLTCSPRRLQTLKAAIIRVDPAGDLRGSTFPPD